MKSPVRRAAASLLELIRVSWMIFGVTLLMLFLLEVGIRVKQARTRPPATRMLAGNPRERPGMRGYLRDHWASWAFGWRPYVYFGRFPSFRGTYVNTDSLGLRVTPQPAAGPTVARVFFFGGSTMWGTWLRDDSTIATEAGRRLQALAGPAGRVEVVNYGESGYVSTQEVIKLMLELRAGRRPDVVVFYDGINDVAATVQSGVPGLPQNESKRFEEFALGRAIDPTIYPQGLRRELRATALLAQHALAQTATVRWARSLRPAAAPSYVAADSAARGTARTYVENVRLVEALAAQYGFTAVYVWQPTLHATGKQLNPFERKLLADIEKDPFGRRLRETHRLVPPLLDSAMAGTMAARFVDASSLFRGDTLAVYTDDIGHNTETAIPRIVDTFWPALERAVRPAIARRGTLASNAPTAPSSPRATAVAPAAGGATGAQ